MPLTEPGVPNTDLLGLPQFQFGKPAAKIGGVACDQSLVPAREGAMSRAVAEIEGLWACLVRWRASDRRPGSATQEAKTAGSGREPKPLAASFASQGRRRTLRVGKRGGWQEMIGAAAADSAYASAASGGSP